MPLFDANDTYQAPDGTWMYDGMAAAQWRTAQRAAETRGEMDYANEFRQIAQALETLDGLEQPGATDPRGVCPGCGEPAMDGKATCGRALCSPTAAPKRTTLEDDMMDETIYEGYFYQPQHPLPSNEHMWWHLEAPLVMEDYQRRCGPYRIAYGRFRSVGRHWEPAE